MQIYRFFTKREAQYESNEIRAHFEFEGTRGQRIAQRKFLADGELHAGEDEAQKLHLRNTTLASNPSSAMSESRSHESGSEKVLRVGPMANHVIVPNQFFGKDVPKLNGLPQMHQSMLTSLFLNVKEAIFPEKLPPLRLTSRPVNVGEIWSTARHQESDVRVAHAACVCDCSPDRRFPLGRTLRHGGEAGRACYADCSASYRLSTCHEAG